MPGRPPSATALRRRSRARARRQPPRAILNTLMALAVIVLERRIRKALRSGTGGS